MCLRDLIPPLRLLVMVSIVLLLDLRPTNGQGRLQLPLARSSVWRSGLDTARNYDDHMLECGGYWYKKRRNNRCGLCGDPADGPLDNEQGGRYATGILTASYFPGQRTQFKVLMNTNQGGYFQFGICPLQNPNGEATQACLDKNRVPLADGSGFKYYLPENQQGVFTVDVVIPQVNCQRCVLQWIYTGDQTWGFDPDGNECRGCGPQYELRNCADVAVTSGATAQIEPAVQRYNDGQIYGRSPEGRYVFNPSSPPASPIFVPSNVNGFGKGLRCVAVGTKKNMRGMDEWCTENCNNDYCPPDTCSCQTSGPAPSETPQINFNDPWGLSVTQYPPLVPPQFNINNNGFVPGSVTPQISPQYRSDEESQTVNEQNRNCAAIGSQASTPGMNEWCAENCNGDFCPRDLCFCEGSDNSGPRRSGEDTSPPEVSPSDPWVVPLPPADLDGPTAGPVTPALQCVAIGTKTGMRGMDQWCNENCNNNYCPRGTCSCQSVTNGNSGPPQKNPSFGSSDPWGIGYSPNPRSPPREGERKVYGWGTVSRTVPTSKSSDISKNPNGVTTGHKRCVGVNPRMGHMDDWCTNNCNSNHCPPSLCACP